MSSRIWKTSFAGSRATEHECLCLLHTPGEHNRNSPPEGNATLLGTVFPLDQRAVEQDLRSASGKSRSTHAVFAIVIRCRCFRGQPAVLSAGSMDQIRSGYLFVLPESHLSVDLHRQPDDYFRSLLLACFYRSTHFS